MTVLMGIRKKQIKERPNSPLEMLTLNEYLDLAKKMIKQYSLGYIRNEMLNDEDCISLVAESIAWADYEYDKKNNVSLDYFRSMHAKFKILKIIATLKKQKNNNVVNFSSFSGPDNEKYLSYDLDYQDEKTTTPEESILEAEKKEKSLKNFNYLTSFLTPTQKNICEMYFMENLSVIEIGKKLKISRAAVYDSLKDSKRKMLSLLNKSNTNIS